MKDRLKYISKFMSLVLRHQPEKIDLFIDHEGWVQVDELIVKMNKRGINASFELIDEVVQTNDKKRFSFNEDKTRIRANQGHSINIEMNLTAAAPPPILYHGTATAFLASIRRTGLQKQQRLHVHLSTTLETAKAVGSRHGKPVVLTIDASSMHAAGYVFYLSENKVWLTDSVPVKYIKE